MQSITSDLEVTNCDLQLINSSLDISNIKSSGNRSIFGDLKVISNNTVNIGSNSSGNIILQGISNSELNIEIKNGLVNLESKADELLNDVQKLKEDGNVR